jgi:hypothetical protein
MRYLTVKEVLDIQRLLIEISGGSSGIRDLGGVRWIETHIKPKS